MHNLLRKQIIILWILICVFAKNAFAQQTEINRPERDDAPYFLGATLGYNNSYLHAIKSTKFIQSDTVLVAQTGSSGGVTIGLLGTARLFSNYLQVRFNPQILIGSARYFTYQFGVAPNNQPAYQKKTLPANIVSFPFQIKFQSDRINNFRVYLLGGIKYDIYFSGNSPDASAQEIQFKSSDFGIEAGIGCSFYFPFFTLSPELKVSDGLSNILIQKPNNPYANVFDKIQTRMIMFSLHFEY